MVNVQWFWWFFGALALIFLVMYLFFAWDTKKAVEESFHPKPSPDLHPHHEEEKPQVVQAEAKAEAPAKVEQAAAAEEDDLKKIEGIGPKVESVLKAAGIRTFRDLASHSAEELQKILDDVGMARIVNPETWAEQAKLAAEGKWDELAALQDTLKGGRRM